ncbi:MAG: OmpA family protein [Sphingobacteriaceae bacterium]|nr:OmpA family protein [Sphingobacteriaceae bacterium]
MKKNIYTGSLILVSLLGISQTASIKKATKSYNNYDYSSVVDKIGDKKEINTDADRKLAESFKMTGDYKNAEVHYAKVANAADKTPEDVYAYAQILRINSKYTEASQQMDAYNTLKAGDSRVALFNSNKQYVTDLLKDNGQFTIKNLEINSAQQDFGPAYYKEQMVYASSRGNVGPVSRVWNGNKLRYLDLYSAKKESSNELTEAKKVSKVDKKYHEGPACFSKDGSIMMYTCDNYDAKSSDGVRKLQLFETKSDKDGKWSDKVPFPYNNDEYSCGHPALTADGNTLYFSSDMPGGKGGVDIYKTTRGADGKWTKPENLGEKINTEGNEMFPFIHESGLFFFSSDGRPGLGGLDVFATEIKDGNINKVINVGSPINSSKDDFTMVLDAEKKKGYFASNREGGKGDDDIYSFDLLKPFVFGKTIKGTAKDKEGNILANTSVNLYDANNTVLKTVTTGEDGTYLFNVDADKQFALNGTKEKYFEGKNTASTAVPEDVIVSDLVLEKDPGMALRGLVTDSKTNSPLEGVKLKFTDNKTGQVFIEELTPATGDVFRPLADKKTNDVLDYKIELVKAGYFPKTVNFNYTIPKPGIVNVHEALAGSLTMDPEVKDIKDLVVINDIRFDLNKFNIRTDAATELDKVVEVMNKYPGMVVELGSHTDCRASKTYNMNLSDKRAKASAAYIKKKITNPQRIYGKGYGESILLNGCACEGAVKSTCSEEEHQKNRRTEFKIISMGGANVDVKNNSTNSFDKK